MSKVWLGFRVVILVTACSVSGAKAQKYPQASLDQATHETVDSLKIDRYAGLTEKGMQAEYQWALGMGKLCLAHALSIENAWYYAIEFQRHAGRTARSRGFGERAIEDYDMAMAYLFETIPILREAKIIPDSRTPEEAAWGLGDLVILRDIADTYLMMGAYEQAEELSNIALERERVDGFYPLGCPADWDRLAKIAQRDGRFAESVRLQRHAVEAQQFDVGNFLGRHPELGHIDPNQPWADVVRHPAVRQVIDDPKYVVGEFTNDLRQVYCQLGRALRVAGQLDEAEETLRTAELTPWAWIGSWRPRLGLYVARERAWLALDRGEAGEARRLAHECLGDYVMSLGERIELIDLVSRALERLGDLQAAFDALKEAIDIVESRRANLVTDENKHFFVAGYASLYRRALDLVIRIHGHDSDEAVEESFEWSERVKARAMLDSLNRYGRRMAVAAARGDTVAMRNLRDLAGKVVSVNDLRNAPWWPADTALLAYTYGLKKTLFLWVITAHGASFHQLEVRPDEVDRHCTALADALSRFDKPDESWVQPASWLYEHTIAPVVSELRGIERLIVVGDGKLCTVPFGVFVTARDTHPGRPVKHGLLIEDFTIAYAPSATVLATISQRPRPDSWDYALWAFASTRFTEAGTLAETDTQQKGPATDYKTILRSARSLSLDDLPHAGREVEQVERMISAFNLGAVKVFVDRPNMKAHLLRASEAGALRSVQFLHFATHATNDPERPYLSGLVLCPPYPVGDRARSPTTLPNRQRERPADTVEHEEAQRSADLPKRWTRQAGRPELLNLAELVGLNLGSDLVVLSACHSLGDTPVQGDWFYGLTRAFLVAGSSGVVCTTTNTSDRGALRVIPALYNTLLNDAEESGRAVDVPRSLRRLKRSWLRSPKYGHPSVWGSWVYYGRACTPPPPKSRKAVR